MNQKKNRDGFPIGPAGDTTAGINSLSEITAINPSFMNLIAPSRPLSNGNPDEIIKQLKIGQKTRPMIEESRAIEKLASENLELKLTVRRLEKQQTDLGKGDSSNFHELQQEIVSALEAQNEDLRKQIEERDKKENSRQQREQLEQRKKSALRDASCQTHLDSINIDELLGASIKLGRIEKEQLQQQSASTHKPQSAQQPHDTPQPPYQHSYQTTQQTHRLAPQPIHQQILEQPHQLPAHQVPQQQQQQQQQPKPTRHDKQPQHQVVSQLYYPSVTLPRASSKQLTKDEKMLLEMLYRIDGDMTTALDKLKALADTQ